MWSPVPAHAPMTMTWESIAVRTLSNPKNESRVEILSLPKPDADEGESLPLILVAVVVVIGGIGLACFVCVALCYRHYQHTTQHRSSIVRHSPLPRHHRLKCRLFQTPQYSHEMRPSEYAPHATVVAARPVDVNPSAPPLPMGKL